MPNDQNFTSCLSAIQNANNLVNTGRLEPVTLPLEIKAFTKLPVLVSAKSGAFGKPLASYAVLYTAVSLPMLSDPLALMSHQEAPSFLAQP